MISDEVRMLANRMKSNPEEFTPSYSDFGDRYRIRESRQWDNLMNSIVHNKPDIEKLFTHEEIELLRTTASEILRPVALATIVKQIVGGTPRDEHEQIEMEYANDN